MTTKLNIRLRQGETFQRTLRWETLPYVYTAITAITRAAPVSITSAGHGLKTGWRAAVVSVLGMREINARYSPPRESELHQVTVVDANTVTINDINSSEFDAYTSGGYLQSFTPVSLAGALARMKIRDRVGGTVLLELTSGAPDNRIVVDDVNHTVLITVAAADTAALTFTTGVYDLEIESAAGVVTTVFRGSVTVLKEVTHA